MKKLKLIALTFIIAATSCGSKGDHAAAYYHQGIAREQLKDYPGAREYYTKAIRDDSSFTDAYISRAYVERQMGNLAGTKADGDKALAIDPKIINKLLTIMKKGSTPNGLAGSNNDEVIPDKPSTQAEEADAITNTDKNTDAEDSEATRLEAKADKENQANDLDSAIADYTRVIGIKPHYAPAYFNRSLMETKLENYIVAMADLDKVIEIVPGHAATYSQRAFVENKLRLDKRALEDCNIAGHLEDRSALTYLNRGIANCHLHNTLSACEDLNTAAQLGSHDAPEWIRKYCK